ncbi:hypothetical protein E2C01_031419 [Portunus trituberculatus]|uniref:Uncharacterized protein n=1 Tax=Portunus trituberculatus TaxID=210409 RepID=A0A5B7EWS1_PORTR|nr:hypothetical protein [Portunus trituberculatus]
MGNTEFFSVMLLFLEVRHTFIQSKSHLSFKILTLYTSNIKVLNGI